MITNDSIAFKTGFGEYMGRWFTGIIPTTDAAQAFINRGFTGSVKWAAGRMIDDAEAMLESYRRNENETAVNANSRLPVVLAAMARDYTPTTGDWGGRQVPRRLVALTDEPNASVYGYAQSAHDVRVQVAFFAAEEATARNLANQFCWFIGQPVNRRFITKYQWGQYELEIPVMLETPDVIITNAAGEQKNLVIMTVDLTFKVVVPHLDAPVPPAMTDGSGRDPEGYPVVTDVSVVHIKNKAPVGHETQRTASSSFVMTEMTFENEETS